MFNKKLDKQDKVIITIIIIILLLLGGSMYNNISYRIKMAILQHNALPKQENKTLKIIKTALYMPILGLKVVLFGSGIFVDIDNDQAPSSGPASGSPQKQYVKF